MNLSPSAALLGVLLVAAGTALGLFVGRLRETRLRLLLGEQAEMLKTANELLAQLSLTDPLTGIANRRSFERSLREAWRRAMRHSTPLSVLVLDLDHFKQLNDTKGHAAGDECLRQVARALETFVRDNGDDAVARWGGEEFVILLGNAGESGAMVVAERIRKAIEQLGVTISIGIATRDNDTDPKYLVDRADRAMFEAKRAGRNCVRLSTGQAGP